MRTEISIHLICESSSREISVKPAAGEIIVEGNTHRVRPKVISVLSYMASRVGEVVSRDELLDQLWSTQPSSDEVLTQAISELRKLLLTTEDAVGMIETIPKIGYRLNAVVRMKNAQPKPFQHLMPEIPPSADPVIFFAWVERLTAQNQILWSAVGVLAFALILSLVVLFGWGPYREDIFVDMEDGKTVTHKKSGFIGPKN